MSDRLDTLVELAPGGFSAWKTNDGMWQLNLKNEDSSFRVFTARTLDDALVEAKDSMRFIRPFPKTLREQLGDCPGVLVKPKRRNIL